MIGGWAAGGTEGLLSQYYELDGVTLWNPSSGVSRLFLRQVAVFEEEVGLFSGIGPMESDEAEISLASFEAFVTALLACRGRRRHGVIQALADGLIATCLVLADRAGATPRWPGPAAGDADAAHGIQAQVLGMPGVSWQARVRAEAEALAGFMAR